MHCLHRDMLTHVGSLAILAMLLLFRLHRQTVKNFNCVSSCERKGHHKRIFYASINFLLYYCFRVLGGSAVLWTVYQSVMLSVKHMENLEILTMKRAPEAPEKTYAEWEHVSFIHFIKGAKNPIRLHSPAPDEWQLSLLLRYQVVKGHNTGSSVTGF